MMSNRSELIFEDQEGFRMVMLQHSPRDGEVACNLNILKFRAAKSDPFFPGVGKGGYIPQFLGT